MEATRGLDPRKICPKIEKPQALTNIEGIIEKSQALMVARRAPDVAIGRKTNMLSQKAEHFWAGGSHQVYLDEAVHV